jgi:hypothetical protein
MIFCYRHLRVVYLVFFTLVDTLNFLVSKDVLVFVVWKGTTQYTKKFFNADFALTYSVIFDGISPVLSYIYCIT